LQLASFGAIANVYAGQILSLSVYIESQSSLEILFGSRARIYLGLAPLAEIVLDELLARYIKHPVAELVEGSNKTLEHRSIETGEPECYIESRDRKLLVASKAPEISS